MTAAFEQGDFDVVDAHLSDLSDPGAIEALFLVFQSIQSLQI